MRRTDRRTERQRDRHTDGQTDGIAVASTALAMRALRRAVKMGKSRHIGNALTDRHKIRQGDTKALNRSIYRLDCGLGWNAGFMK